MGVDRTSRHTLGRRGSRQTSALPKSVRVALAAGGNQGSQLAGLAAFAVFTVVCVLAAYTASSAGAKSKAAGSEPKTIAECKQKFKYPAECILRVGREKSKCPARGLPCLGPIVSHYSMDGGGWGDTKLIKATFGYGTTGGTVVREGRRGNPETRPVSWHSVPSVKIVAVFIFHGWEPTRGHVSYTIQRIPTGPHSGHTTLKWFDQAAGPHNPPTGPEGGPPGLLLEGKRILGKAGRRQGHAPTRYTGYRATKHNGEHNKRPKVGSSCAHPLFSADSVIGAPVYGSDTKDVVAAVNETPHGVDQMKALQLQVTIRNSRVVICRAEIWDFPAPVGGHSNHILVHVSTAGLSNQIKVPWEDGLAGFVWFRLKSGKASAAHRIAAYTATNAGAKAPAPKTVAQCQKQFKYPAECILRVGREKSKCRVYPRPCLGPIISEYAMDGLGGYDTKLIWATFGYGTAGAAVVREGRSGNPETRPVSWHSVPSVKIVAVFIVHEGAYVPEGNHGETVQRIPTGPHSGRTTLKWFNQAAGPHSPSTGPDAGPPRLLLEGKRISRQAGKASNASGTGAK